MRQLGRTRMNEHRTCTGSDTRLTQRCSPPVAAPRHLNQVTRQALALGLSVERIDVGLAVDRLDHLGPIVDPAPGSASIPSRTNRTATSSLFDEYLDPRSA